MGRGGLQRGNQPSPGPIFSQRPAPQVFIALGRRHGRGAGGGLGIAGLLELCPGAAGGGARGCSCTACKLQWPFPPGGPPGQVERGLCRSEAQWNPSSGVR